MRKYVSIFNLSFIHTLKNYRALIGLCIFLMTCLLVFANLWQIAAARAGFVVFNPAQLLWYIAFNEWLLVSLPNIQDDMERDLRSGRLAYLLPRPISYLGACYAEAAGILCVNLIVLGAVTFLFTWWQAGGLPFSFSAFVVTIVLSFFAGSVAIIFEVLIGLSAFWVHEVDPIYWIWEKCLFMLGGLILPLTVYPSWMQTVARYTPFPALLGDRSALVFDSSAANVWNLVAMLCAWGAIGVVAVLLVYRRGMRIVNIEGG